MKALSLDRFYFLKVFTFARIFEREILPTMPLSRLPGEIMLNKIKSSCPRLGPLVFNSSNKALPCTEPK